MDRRVSRKNFRIAMAVAAGVGVLALAAFVWAIRPAPSGYYVVDAKRLQIATAAEGMFDEFVATLGTVTPGLTVYLDAVEGGRVEKVLANGGDVVKKGQALLELSNTQLRLDVLARETEVASQLNSLSAKELELQRSRINNARNLAQAKMQMETLERDVARSERLAKEGAFAQATLEDKRAQYELQKEIFAFAQETLTTDERMNSAQMEQMRLSTENMKRNLATARSSLDALTVRAPADGTLTSFNPELGQSLGKGARVGQIDSNGDLKLTVSVDEFYLGRFQSGLTGEATIGDKKYELKVGRVSAQVESGTFKADLLFVGDAPESLRRGQSFPVKIFISEPAPALLLPNGPFITATGGRWAFVVSADGNTATKRNITLGRRNVGAIEVVDGIKRGERVVVSDYEGFGTAKALQIRNNKSK
jgi:HlyD family secretion protein